jgi:catechol 2,3-dioxygenase-like lactoylglutathione lyase family enzyme
MKRVGVTSFVHTGVVVDDLTTAVGFFTLLALECSEPFAVGGEWVDRIVGLPAVRAEAVTVRTPHGTDALELVKLHEPPAEPDAQPAPPNRRGIRHLAFAVDDTSAVVDRLRTAGWHTVGEIVDYQGMFPLCYVRGPEGSSSSPPSVFAPVRHSGQPEICPEDPLSVGHPVRREDLGHARLAVLNRGDRGPRLTDTQLDLRRRCS